MLASQFIAPRWRPDLLGFFSALLLLQLLGALPAFASQPASGQFHSTRTCEAYLSFVKETNPGRIKVVPGTDYAIREVHTPQAQWLRVQIPHSKEPLRWVAAQCGEVRDLTLVDSRAPTKTDCNQADQHDSFVLAVTWQPGFCEHVQYGGKKPECDHMESGRLVVSNLTLHGLWPNRKQCGASYANCGIAPLALFDDTVSYIAPWMPNFYFESTFGSYQWKKHGSCQTTMDANSYFRRSVDAVRMVDESSVGQLIRSNIGATMSRAEFFRRLGQTTGMAKPQNHVGLLCVGEYLHEIRFRLALNFWESANMRELLRAPASEATMQTTCPEDIRIEASGKN